MRGLKVTEAAFCKTRRANSPVRFPGGKTGLKEAGGGNRWLRGGIETTPRQRAKKKKASIKAGYIRCENVGGRKKEKSSQQSEGGQLSIIGRYIRKTRRP